MTAIPAPTLVLPQEEWPDADFDLPEGAPLTAPSVKDDDLEDWDAEMNLDIKGARAEAVALPTLTNSGPFDSPQLFSIRPPIAVADFDEDDEGVSTIKAMSIPTIKNSAPKASSAPIEEDFEDAFALPDDLTQLSLAPQSLSHRSSKNSLEWGDKDNTSSSQSSDAYSLLGFADISPSSQSTSSASSICFPETESEHDEDEDELEGLVIPSDLFDSGQGGRQLKKILDMKKKAQYTNNHVKVASADPEDDFETGIIFDDSVDLTPSRLLYNAKTKRIFNRSNSMPPHRASTLRPPSRMKVDRAKSPVNPPPSSTRQLQKIRLSPSPPLRPPSRSQTFSALKLAKASDSPSPSPSSTFLAPKPGSLRGQKSHTGLKPTSPPSSVRKLTRKVSLSSLMEPLLQASGSGSTESGTNSRAARYEETTAASRAKTQRSSTSRINDFKVPPTRPSTPSSNPAALRLTLPTQSRLKSRPALSQVFTPVSPVPISSGPQSTSPIPPRPPSNLSVRVANRVPAPLNPSLPAPKVLKRPKRLRTYGDGTELDGFADLPTDREKEGRFRVQPKGYGNRIPGATYGTKNLDKSSGKGTVWKKGKQNGNDTLNALAPSTNTLRRTTTRIEFPLKASSINDTLPKRKTISSPNGQTRRKPTLIRNLGGAGGPKVVGDMKWNPNTLRWEGNDQVLRDFDAAVGTSTRPALITHLTGSSIGSPVGSFSSGARKVGNMIFDPAQMCWISTLPPDEEEPDPFANLADDEDNVEWDSKAATLRATCTSQPASARSSRANSSSSSDCRLETPSPSHIRTISESGSDRGSRASLMVCDVDEAFVASCRAAEQRHSAEMKGWKSSFSKLSLATEPDRSYLYEIRALATRKY